jgi:hypothetical protein
MKIFLLLVLIMSHTPRNIQGSHTEADFWAQWSSVNPRITLFILVTPQSFWTDISPIGFTSNTRDMTLPGHPGVTFKSSPGITPTVVEQVLGEAANLEMTGIYQSASFMKTDVLAGKWNFATIEIFSASWQNKDLGELVHFKGNLGEFKDYQQYFTAEGRGLIARLSNDVNKATQRSCRVKDFGDTECGKDLSGTVDIGGTDYDIRQVSVEGTPGLGGSRVIFDVSTFSGNIPGDFDALDAFAASFANGKITALDGQNAGISREIAAGISEGIFPSMALYWKRSFPYPVTHGDLFTLTMGCTRTLESCRKYENAENFRAEAFVPGIEAANRIPPGN